MFDDRGISDVVGFILTFGVIIISVGLVTVVGYQQLDDQRTNQELSNAERVMRLIEEDYDALQHNRKSVQTNEVDVTRGNLDLSTDGSVTIEVHTATGANPVFADIPLGAIQYRVDDRSVVYQNGMIARVGNGQIELTDPSVSCSPSDRAVVSIASIEGDPQSISGTVSIVGQTTDRKLLYPLNRTGENSTTDATGVDLTINSEYDAVWDRVLVENGGWTKSSGTYTCSGVDRVYIRQTNISVRFAN